MVLVLKKNIVMRVKIVFLYSVNVYDSILARFHVEVIWKSFFPFLYNLLQYIPVFFIAFHLFVKIWLLYIYIYIWLF